MDLPRFVRRLSSYGDESNNNFGANNFAAVAPSSRPGSGLTVDTSVAKTSFRKLNTLERSSMDPQPQWGDETPTPNSQLSRQATPTSTRSEDSEQHLRRRRSNSECLLMAKNGVQDLPGPCKEYISSVKQILARSEDSSRPPRRRSMSMRANPVINPGIVG